MSHQPQFILGSALLCASLGAGAAFAQTHVPDPLASSAAGRASSESTMELAPAAARPTAQIVLRGLRAGLNGALAERPWARRNALREGYAQSGSAPVAESRDESGRASTAD